MAKIKIILLVLFGVTALALVWFFQISKFGQKEPAQLLLSAEEARQKIRMRTEVQKYEIEMEKLGSNAEIEVEDLGEDWFVHVFETVEDGGGISHTATFGWYTVNKKTGAVERDI